MITCLTLNISCVTIGLIFTIYCSKCNWIFYSSLYIDKNKNARNNFRQNNLIFYIFYLVYPTLWMHIWFVHILPRKCTSYISEIVLIYPKATQRVITRFAFRRIRFWINQFIFYQCFSSARVGLHLAVFRPSRTQICAPCDRRNLVGFGIALRSILRVFSFFYSLPSYVRV